MTELSRGPPGDERAALRLLRGRTGEAREPLFGRQRLVACARCIQYRVPERGACVAGGADMLYALSRGMGGRHLDINISNMILVMLVAPGAALLLGVLPFTHRSERLDAQ